MYLDPTIPTTAPVERHAPSALLARLCAGTSLTEGETESLFGELVAGNLDLSEIAALLVALKVKGDERLVQTMARHGFVWGGSFAHPDTTHFEWVGQGA